MAILRDKTVLSDAGAVNSNSASFKFKQKITGKTAAAGTKNVELMVSLKHLDNFCRTLKMCLINCEINLIVTWSAKCVWSNDTKVTTFTITDTKLDVPVVTLSTQDNAKLLQPLKSCFTTFYLLFQNTTDRTINIKYYLLTIEIKDYNVMISGQNFFDQPVKNNLRT